ncbi:MAG: M48 family metalloprotease [Planctomycetaceae bacterium]|nr:M48 family metalloprotease [Planctomycetaceae bacterium]
MSNTMTNTILQFLAANAIWFALLGTLVFLASRTILKRNATVHLLWVLLLVKILLPPIFSLEFGVWSNRSVESGVLSVERSSECGVLSVESENDSNSMLQTQNVTPQSQNSTLYPTHSTPQTPNFAPQNVGQVRPLTGTHESKFIPHELLLLPVLFGSLIYGVTAMWRIMRFRSLLRKTETAPDEIHQIAMEIASKLGLRTRFEVRIVDACLPPMVWAFFEWPRILLPRHLVKQLDAGSIRLLLAHELAHLKRGDHLVRYLELAATLVFWWHPMLWLARRELRESEELCCDAWATWLFPGKNRDYGRALMATIDYLSGEKTILVPTAGSGMSMKETKRRIEMIMKSNVPRTVSWPVRLVVLAFALVILPLSAKLVAKQETPKPQETNQQQEAAPPAAPQESKLQEPKEIKIDPETEFLETVTVIVKNEDTTPSQPMEGVELRITGNGDAAKIMQDRHLPEKVTSDKNGEAVFPVIRKKAKNQQQTNMGSYGITATPMKKEEKVYVGKYGFSIFLEDNPLEHRGNGRCELYVSEGHLLVGQVVDAKTNQPLTKTYDKNEVRVGVCFVSPITNGFSQFDPYYAPPGGVPVDANGIFQFYVPRGVCWPLIMNNDGDQIWDRTIDNVQWAKEGVRIRPGKITTITFRVQPRLDDNNVAREPLPVLEEQLAAAKLVMFGGSYTLDENRHVTRLIPGNRTTFKEQWPLIKELKELQSLDLIKQDITKLYTEEGIERVLEIPKLQTLFLWGMASDTSNWSKTLEGRENIQKFLKEELPKIRDLTKQILNKPQGGGMRYGGAVTGGGGGMGF